MSARDPLWYWLNDPTDEIAASERTLDRIDLEIDGLRRICHEETKERLARLGIDTTNYKPMPHLRQFELRSSQHLTADHNIEQLVVEATESKLDRLYRETFGEHAGEVFHHPPGTVLRRAFPATFTVR